jgi:hypothetical protein
MGIFEFLKKEEKGPDYSKAVRRVGVWKKMWKSHNAGQHLVIEKEREMSRPISLGTSPGG